MLFGLWFAYCLNLCLVIDLVIMIKYPLSQKDKFMKIYFLISFMFSMVVSLSVGFTATAEAAEFNNLISLIAYILLWSAGAWSIYYAVRRLTKPGISGSERSLVLYRHAIGILIFLLTNFYVICGCFYEVFDWNMP